MELEELVPDIELCKLIPEGEFADSALVWCQMYQGEKHRLLRRDSLVNDTKAISAPTFEEITKELGQFTASCYDRGYIIEIATGWDCVSADSAVDGAMKLRLKTKGIKYEKD